jgi:hypothetical protein
MNLVGAAPGLLLLIMAVMVLGTALVDILTFFKVRIEVDGMRTEAVVIRQWRLCEI